MVQGDDDFEAIDSIAEVGGGATDEENAPAPPAKRRRGAASVVEKACPMPECPEKVKKGGKFCLRHQRFYDVMRYQAGNDGPDLLTEFNDAMKDHDVMVEEVGIFAAANADVPGAKKKKKRMNWAEFRTRNGVRKNKKDGSRRVPFEKEQWILREVNKFGRRRDQATQEWDKHDRDHLVDKDYMGFQSQVRLWLRKTEWRDIEMERFIEGAAQEGGERQRNPNSETRLALRNHAHDMFGQHGVSSNDDFFSGASMQITPRRNRAEAAVAAAVPAAAAAEDLEEDQDSEDVPPAPSPEKVSESRARTKQVAIVELEDAPEEGETKVVRVNAKRKKVNIQDTKMALYTKAFNGLACKKTDIEARITEANTVLMLESQASPAADSDKTDKLTRQIKVTSIQQLRALAEVMLNKIDMLPAGLLAPPQVQVKVKAEARVCEGRRRFESHRRIATESVDFCWCTCAGLETNFGSGELSLPDSDSLQNYGQDGARESAGDALGTCFPAIIGVRIFGQVAFRRSESNRRNRVLDSRIGNAMEAEAAEAEEKQQPSDAAAATATEAVGVAIVKKEGEVQDDAKNDSKVAKDSRAENPSKTTEHVASIASSSAQPSTDEGKGDPGDVLADALRISSKAHCIGFPHHARRYDWMECWAEGIMESETEEEVERRRVIWKRLETVLLSFNTAFKSTSASLKKYMDKKETDRQKAENKKKEAQDKERLRSQRCELENRAKTLATSGNLMPKVFSIDRDLFTEIEVCSEVDKFDVCKARRPGATHQIFYRIFVYVSHEGLIF